jgi:hypothetical protein
MIKPLRQRPLDLFLFAFYCIALANGLLMSLPESLGVPVTADSPWPPLQWLYGWAVAEEPAHLLVPQPAYLHTAALLDGWIHAPFIVVLLHALWMGSNWIRPWALLFAGSAVTNMLYYLMATFSDPAFSPPHTVFYLCMNLPWMLVPMLLAWRVRKHRPFDA